MEKDKTNNKKENLLTLTSSRLPTIGKKSNIDPYSKFNAQLVLSRENVDVKAAKFATKLAQEELIDHEMHLPLLCVAVLNEAEIFGTHYKTAEKLDSFNDSNELDRVWREKKRIEKLISDNKDQIIKGDEKEWSTALLTFYSGIALFDFHKKTQRVTGK